jgi:Bacterial SH3 domain
MKRLFLHLFCAIVLTFVVVSAVSAQSDTLSDVTFTLYRDEESLTFYFSGAGEIPFHNIRIDVYLPNEEVVEFALQDYPTFETLLIRRPLQAPTCLRLELRDSDVPYPLECQRLTSQQRRVEDNIGRAGIFWYDDEINVYYLIEIFQNDVFIGDCPPDLVEDEVCEVTFTPQPMPEYIPPTPRPTATPAPAQPTVVPTVSTRAYPCTAQVDPNSPSSILNVVRQSPNSTTVIASVRRGDQVTVIERSAGANVFYRIQSGGRTIGWIAAQYLALSATCPA